MQKPARLFRCHSDRVHALSTSGANTAPLLLVSGGADGRACVYDLHRKTLIDSVKCASSVTCVVAVSASSSGMTALIGYSDGVVRLFRIDAEADAAASERGTRGSVAGNIFKLTRALSVK